MKAGQKLWTKEELILAINLYCKLPFGKLHRNNPEVIRLAGLLGRTSSSIAYKLVNFASLDPSLQARGIKGASNTSKLDKEIWDEFFNNWDVLPYESEKLRAALENSSLEHSVPLAEAEFPKEGKERVQMVKVRVNQAFFRTAVLAAYNDRCCITGLQNPQLLIAGHISAWGRDEKNRVNPRNGIAINALHDKAFEHGLLTITPDYRIKISSVITKNKKDPSLQDLFIKYDQAEIILPSRFLPDPELLDYHNQERFVP